VVALRSTICSVAARMASDAHMLLVPPWAWKKGSYLTKKKKELYSHEQLSNCSWYVRCLYVCACVRVCVVCRSAATSTKSWPLSLSMELGVTIVLTLSWVMLWCIKLFRVVSYWICLLFNAHCCTKSVESSVQLTKFLSFILLYVCVFFYTPESFFTSPMNMYFFANAASRDANE
jgi:hypothetical protein